MTGRLIDDDAGLRELVTSMRRVAVLGIKTERQSGQPAYYVPEYLSHAGVEVIPVPVYYPEVTEILGRAVVRRVADAPGPIDVVDVFRRPEDLLAHLDDIAAARPRAVWLQSGIRHDGFADALRAREIDVVQDRCLMVEHRRLAGVSRR